MQLKLNAHGSLNVCTFSPCERYRYTLAHHVNRASPLLPFIGLNPSTADQDKHDPTVKRCLAFARREGYGGPLMLNLFAFRATDPREMKAQEDPVGPDNDATLRTRCHGRAVVCAWGTHGEHLDRAAHVVQLLRDVNASMLCLGVTKDGHPRHPLYLSRTTALRQYTRR